MHRSLLREGALCAGSDPERLFTRGSAQRDERALCYRCPARVACLVEALEARVEYGVWGGLTERERRAVHRARPDVESWATWVRESDDELAVALRDADGTVPVLAITRAATARMTSVRPAARAERGLSAAVDGASPGRPR